MKTSSWLVVPQKYLGTGGLVALLVVGSIATPLSLDMYTPAVPHMTEAFNTTDAMVNLTIFGYFLFFAIGLLVFGPISERYGRKRVLTICLADYAIASALCALSPTIEVLIGLRVLQALGAGAFCAVTTAIVKDAFTAEKRQSVLFVMQAMFVVGPVAAPVIGAIVLQFASWRMIFWVLALVGALCFVAVLLMKETLPVEQRFQGSALGSLTTLGTVLKNKGFTIFLLITAIYEVAYMAYVAVASHVYITTFGCSDLEYSLFFAVAALVTAVAPFLWNIASKVMTLRTFLCAQIVIALVSGVLMLLLGEISAFSFCITFIIFAFTEAIVRPLSTNICLTQQKGDTGAAASLINFMRAGIGAVGMLLIVLPWPNYIVGIAWLAIITMVIALVGWVALMRSSIPLALVKTPVEELEQVNSGK